MAQLTDDAFAFGGELMPVDQAIALIGERLPVLAGVEDAPLWSADGRVLAHDVVARVALPPFDNSAVDGYATRTADLSPGSATRLPVRGRVAAGHGAAALDPGSAARVFTGAPVPVGTDVVFMQEDVTADGDHVLLPPGLKPGANLRRAGEDIERGAVALLAGRRLRPQDVALAAALGCASLQVRRRLRVGLFSTGDELREPGETLGPAQIYDSNRALLAALLARMGVEVSDLGRLRDDRDAVQAALSEAAGAHDLLVTSGGVSMGEEDHVRAAVEATGAMVFWRLAIKPGRPVALGVVDGTPLVGLPGNPVAVFVTGAHVLRPLVARLRGEALEPLPAFPVRCGFSYRKKAGRREYVRVSLRQDGDGGCTAAKHPRDGAGVLSSLTETAGLIELEEDRLTVEPGESARFIPYGLLW
ncbi:molybdopterin molybdenumtransferase MoeA [Alsobacter metallidurans]|uniref:Molybdopterin molybdenumtransferase n=1 Tax=Alsobacter metallidurans TaxID=340221 RepID=A0A917I9V3_9HYPH|nr:gephyrin-like molybdotransferase Glp [Alsobacter metallidurans]GGH27186.1 molybdopterin molybdenumtransferase MoeA [Alsobacter metallidurans]